jgi:FemAB-related protein (PEP-CTERM system-associated)
LTNIALANNSDQSRWDEFVNSVPDAGPYHLFAWKRAIEESYGHKAHYLIAQDENGKLTGVLPLVFIKPPLMKGSLVTLPFCDYGGILSQNKSVSEDLLSYSISLAESLKTNLEIRSTKLETMIEEKTSLGVMSHKVRMILDLPGDAEALMGGFKSKLRSQIKKPMKEGLSFKIGSVELIDDFYNVFRINMHDLGSPVHSKRFISSVVGLMGGNANIGIVFSNDKAIGCGVILKCRDTVTIPWASTLLEYNRLSPNMLLYWGFLEHAADAGYRYFDFGRSTPNEGTYKFKEQWGARPHPLFWYGKGFRDEPENQTDKPGMRERIAAAWAKLPQSVADIAGPILRKYISL